jgi:hypothetical protein
MQGAEVEYAGKPHSGGSQKILVPANLKVTLLRNFVLQRSIWLICEQEIFYATQHNQPLGCRFLAT